MRPRPAILPVAICGVVMCALFVPMYTLFLRRVASKGVNGWNAGPSQEFAFQVQEGAARALAYFVQFFVRNFHLTFEAQVAPVPDWHPAYRVIGVLLGVLAVIGLGALARSEDRTLRAMGRFAIAFGVTWILLVVRQRVTLGPTRHTMIMLPVFALCVTAGVISVSRRWLGRPQWHRIPLAITLVLAICALTALPRARVERQRPLHEPSLERLLAEHKVSVLYTYGCTVDALIMPSIRFAYHVFNEECVGPTQWHAPLPRKIDRIAFLSLRDPFTDLVFERARDLIAADGASRVAQLTLPPRTEMTESYRESRRSRVEVDVSRRTRNGTNDLYLVILERRPAHAPP